MKNEKPKKMKNKEEEKPKDEIKTKENSDNKTRMIPYQHQMIHPPILSTSDTSIKPPTSDSDIGGIFNNPIIQVTSDNIIYSI